jgi:hypothetical protein
MKNNNIYESHITIDNITNIDFFKFVCGKLKLKPILIELPTYKVSYQLMTSKYHNNNNLEKLKIELLDTVNKLREYDFIPIRLKIEASLNNYTVPILKEDIKNIDDYFEFHFKVLINNPLELDKLKISCKENQLYISSNAFKSLDNNKHERFITLRVFNTIKSKALEKYNDTFKILKREDFKILNVEKEYVVYDTNINLDNRWILEC